MTIWRAANRKKLSAQSMQWAKANPDRFKEISKRYRIKKADADPEFAAKTADWLDRITETDEQRQAIEELKRGLRGKGLL